MNVFDSNLSGGIDNAQMDGLLKELKKGVKKLTKIPKKIGAKILPESVAKVGRKIDDTGLPKLAAGAALLYAGAPFIASGASKISALASKAGAMMGKGTAILSAGSKLVAQPSGGYVKLAQDETMQNALAAQQLMQQLGTTPQMRQAIEQMLMSGATPDQILSEWVSSESFRALAVPQVAQTVYPQVYSAAAQQMPAPAAANFAAYKSEQMAQNAVSQVRGEQNLLPLIIGIGLAALLGAA